MNGHIPSFAGQTSISGRAFTAFRMTKAKRDVNQGLPSLQLAVSSRSQRCSLPITTLERGTPSGVESSQALLDIWREPELVLNSVQFSGDGHLFIKSLRRLASTIVARQRKRNESHVDRLIEALVQRCARTSAGADAYFAVEKLLGIDNREGSIDMVVAPKRETEKLPIDIRCILQGANIFCQIIIHNPFSVYRPFVSEGGLQWIPSTSPNAAGGDLEVASLWLDVQTTVTDVITLSPADEPRAKDWVRSLRVATLALK